MRKRVDRRTEHDRRAVSGPLSRFELVSATLGLAPSYERSMQIPAKKALRFLLIPSTVLK